MNTLSERKSVHGIEYVKQMLNAFEESKQKNNADSIEFEANQTSSNALMKSLFYSKRRRNLEENKETEKNPQTISEAIIPVLRRRTTSSGEELHKKTKRPNTTRQKSTKVIIDFETEAGKKSSDAQTDSIIKPKRRVKASKTRTASSTEQLLKKPKTEIGIEKKEPQVRILLDLNPIEIPDVKQNEEIIKTVNRSTSPSKLKFLSKFENASSDTPFLLPVACAPLLSKVIKEENAKQKVLFNEDLKINSIEQGQLLTTKKKRVCQKDNKILESTETERSKDLKNNKASIKEDIIKKTNENTVFNKDEHLIIPIAFSEYSPSIKSSNNTTKKEPVKQIIKKDKKEITENSSKEKTIKKVLIKNDVEVNSSTPKMEQAKKDYRRIKNSTSEVLKESAESKFKNNIERKKDESGKTETEIKLKIETDFQLRRRIFENEDVSLLNQLDLLSKTEQSKKFVETLNSQENLNKKIKQNSNKIVLSKNEQKEVISSKITSKTTNISTDKEIELENNKVKKRVIFLLIFKFFINFLMATLNANTLNIF